MINDLEKPYISPFGIGVDFSTEGCILAVSENGFQVRLEYAELKNTLNSLLEMVSLIKQATVK